MLARPKVKVLSLALAVVWMATQCMAFQATPSPEAKQRYAQARRLLALGEKDKAIEELKAVIQLSPQFIEAQRDYLDNQRDKAESFIEQYEGYVKQNPDSAVYHYLLGKVYSNANKRDKSDAEFKKALELDPKSGWAMLAMSSVATRAGDSARSIELLKGVGENAGDSVALRLAVANGLLSKKLYDEPLKQAEHILRIDPETFDAWTIRWQAKMSLSFGADETRAEVLREIQDLEAKHGKDIRALLVARSGYQMLDDEKGADRAKKVLRATAVLILYGQRNRQGNTVDRAERAYVHRDFLDERRGAKA
jgi:tetratricopeptide (TPR) repeat protein